MTRKWIDDLKIYLTEFVSSQIRDIHLKELVSGSSISLFFTIVGALLQFLFTFLIARIWGAETMGIYALSITVLGIFATILLVNFEENLILKRR